MRAAYDSIYFELRRLIEDGTYAYRSFLPSESALVKRFGCAHNTVRKALGLLAVDGYVQPVHGKGVRVLYNTPRDNKLKPVTFCTTRIQSFVETGKAQGFLPTTQVLLMENLVVDKPLSELTRFDVGEEVLHAERVRYYGDDPLSYDNSYYRADIVEGITKQDAEKSLYEYVETVCGVRLVTCRRRVTVERATEHDREVLHLDDIDSVAVVNAIVFDGDGLMCEHTETRLHPDVFSLEQVAIQSRTNIKPV